MSFPRRYDGPFQKVKRHKDKSQKPGLMARLRASKRSSQQRKDAKVYAVVDARDGLKSRLSGIATEGIERHHIRYRSLGGRSTLDNVISLTPSEHRQIHAGMLKLEGNAEEVGGVKVWWFNVETGALDQGSNI